MPKFWINNNQLNKHRNSRLTTSLNSLWVGMLGLALGAFAIIGCGQEQYTPKPRLYPRVVYPVRQYEEFDTSFCRFSFEMPTYMKAIQDDKFFDEAAPDPCWLNLEMPAFNGTVYLTYVPLRNANDLYKVFEDAYRLAGEHNLKASANQDFNFRNAAGVTGLVFEIEGDVASPFQFIVTDSSRHALRGALYIRAEPKEDSLKPIIEFVKVDILHILNTFSWQ